MSKNIIWVTTEVVMNTGGDYNAANKLCGHLHEKYGANAAIVFIVINTDQSNIPLESAEDVLARDRYVISLKLKGLYRGDLDGSISDSMNLSEIQRVVSTIPSELSQPDMIIRCAKFDQLGSHLYQELFERTNQQSFPPIVLNVTEYNSSTISILNDDQKIGTTVYTGLGEKRLGIEVATTPIEPTNQLVAKLSDPIKKLVGQVDNSCAIISGYLSTQMVPVNSVDCLHYIQVCLKLMAQSYKRFIFILKFDSVLKYQVEHIAKQYGFNIGKFIIKQNNNFIDYNEKSADIPNNDKIIDFIDAFPVSKNDMKLLQKITDNCIKVRLCTGDQSAAECDDSIRFYQIVDHKINFYNEGIIGHASAVVGERSLLVQYYKLLAPNVVFDLNKISTLLSAPKIYEESRKVWEDIKKNYNLNNNLMSLIDILLHARNLAISRKGASLALFIKKFENILPQASVRNSFYNVYFNYINRLTYKYYVNDPVLLAITHFILETNQPKAMHPEWIDVVNKSLGFGVLPMQFTSSKQLLTKISGFFSLSSGSQTSKPKNVSHLFEQIRKMPVTAHYEYICLHKNVITNFAEFLLLVDILDIDLRFDFAMRMMGIVQSFAQRCQCITRMKINQRYKFISQHPEKIVTAQQLIELLPLLASQD